MKYHISHFSVAEECLHGCAVHYKCAEGECVCADAFEGEDCSEPKGRKLN